MIKKIILMVLTAALYYFIFDFRINADGINYCYSDAYMNAQYWGDTVLLFISELYIIIALRYEFRESIIILENNMKKVWMRVCRKIAAESAFVTLYSFAVCTVYVYLRGFSYHCNWQDDYSGAWLQYLRHIDTYVDTWIIQCLYLIIIFSEISVTAMIIMLSWWWLRLPVYGYGLLVALVTVIKNGADKYDIFYSVISMSPPRIYLYGINYVNNLLVPLAAILIAWLAGMLLLRKRDMLKKEADV